MLRASVFFSMGSGEMEGRGGDVYNRLEEEIRNKSAISIWMEE